MSYNISNPDFRVDTNKPQLQGGAISVPTSLKTGTYLMTAADHTIRADATGGTFTVTLPPATNAGQVVFIKKGDASVNGVTVSRDGGDTIDGLISVSLAVQNASRLLIADGVNRWLVTSLV